jgi:hypothetical protein
MSLRMSGVIVVCHSGGRLSFRGFLWTDCRPLVVESLIVHGQHDRPLRAKPAMREAVPLQFLPAWDL